MSVGGQIGGLYESGAAGGMPPPAITDISDGYHPGYPLSACNLPMTPSRRDHQNGAAAAMSEARTGCCHAAGARMTTSDEERVAKAAGAASGPENAVEQIVSARCISS